MRKMIAQRVCDCGESTSLEIVPESNFREKLR